MLRVPSINMQHVQIRFSMCVGFKIVEVMWVDIGRDIEFTRDELVGQIADAGTDLQHPVANVGPQRFPHPQVELAGRLQLHQDGRTILVLAVNVVNYPEVDHGGQGASTIASANLLTLLVTAGKVANGNFEDACAPLG